MYINFTKTQQNAEKILKNFLFLSAFCSFYGTILLNLAEPFLENLQKSWGVLPRLRWIAYPLCAVEASSDAETGSFQRSL